jgi:hypothetical protein
MARESRGVQEKMESEGVVSWKATRSGETRGHVATAAETRRDAEQRLARFHQFMTFGEHPIPCNGWAAGGGQFAHDLPRACTTCVMDSIDHAMSALKGAGACGIWRSPFVAEVAICLVLSCNGVPEGEVYDGGGSATMGPARNGMFGGAQHSHVAIPCVKKDVDDERTIPVSVVAGHCLVSYVANVRDSPKSIRISSTRPQNLKFGDSASVPQRQYGLHGRLQAEGGSLGM